VRVELQHSQDGSVTCGLRLYPETEQERRLLVAMSAGRFGMLNPVAMGVLQDPKRGLRIQFESHIVPEMGCARTVQNQNSAVSEPAAPEVSDAVSEA
jgi:hypothetical protein